MLMEKLKKQNTNDSTEDAIQGAVSPPGAGDGAVPGGGSSETAEGIKVERRKNERRKLSRRDDDRNDLRNRVFDELRNEITLKDGVRDPQGAAVDTVLKRTGMEENADVKVGKYFTLGINADNESTAREIIKVIIKILFLEKSPVKLAK